MHESNAGAERQADGRLIGWPRDALSCEFLAPARFGDELDVHVQVVACRLPSCGGYLRRVRKVG
jgi:acyl-CoA thioesterase FadM